MELWAFRQIVRGAASLAEIEKTHPILGADLKNFVSEISRCCVAAYSRFSKILNAVLELPDGATSEQIDTVMKRLHTASDTKWFRDVSNICADLAAISGNYERPIQKYISHEGQNDERRYSLGILLGILKQHEGDLKSDIRHAVKQINTFLADSDVSDAQDVAREIKSEIEKNIEQVDAIYREIEGSSSQAAREILTRNVKNGLQRPNGEKHLVVLVHGIRTFAYWMTDIKPVLQDAGLAVAATSYGRFNLLRFLLPLPWLKEGAIERIRSDITDAIAIHEPDRVSVIAHSFGTFVIAKIIERYPETELDTVIFCGSVLSEDFPFKQFRGRFRSIVNEVGTRDVLPALAQSVTWGYGSIGTHGLNSPSVENRWHNGLSHSEFLTPEFTKKFWIPLIKCGTFVNGDKAKTSKTSRILSAIPLKWMIVAIIIAVAIFWPYIFVREHTPEANLDCDLYYASTSQSWRAHKLLPVTPGSFYVIAKSFPNFRTIPIINAAYAKLETARLRRRFPRVDFDTMATASLRGDNKMWAIVLARGIRNQSDACEIKKMAVTCGLQEEGPPYVYKLRHGPVDCN